MARPDIAVSTVLPEGEVHMRDGERRLVGKIVNVATCDSRGHLRGPGEKCVFCGIPLEKPMARPTGSNADEWALFLEHWLGPVQGINFVAVQIAEAIENAQALKPPDPPAPTCENGSSAL